MGSTGSDASHQHPVAYRAARSGGADSRAAPAGGVSVPRRRGARRHRQPDERHPRRTGDARANDPGRRPAIRPAAAAGERGRARRAARCRRDVGDGADARDGERAGRQRAALRAEGGRCRLSAVRHDAARKRRAPRPAAPGGDLDRQGSRVAARPVGRRRGEIRRQILPHRRHHRRRTRPAGRRLYAGPGGDHRPQRSCRDAVDPARQPLRKQISRPAARRCRSGGRGQAAERGLPRRRLGGDRP